MITCKWNESIEALSWRVGFAGCERVLTPETAGDPFHGEPLCFAWDTVRDAEVTVTVTLPERAFLDGVVICTGDKTALRYARLFANGIRLDEYCAETGKTVTEHTLELSAGMETAELCLSFCCDFSELSLLSIDLYGSVREKVDLFPCPQSVCFGDGVLSVECLNTYTASGESVAAGRVWAEKLMETAGVTAIEDPYGAVCFLADAGIPQDGYRLEVTEKGAIVKASNARGFVIGAEALIKLIQNGEIPVVTLEDAPHMPFRGVHLMVPSREQMPFAKRLIKYVISPLCYNVVILELAGLGMRFDSHPEIADTVEKAIEQSRRGEMPRFPHGESVGGGRAVEKETLKEFIDYIRSFGIEVIPEVQSLGHVQFMTYTYPEIAELDPVRAEEVDIRLADALPAQVYPHCYCPSNPRSYEILFDILDEVIELFAPLKYVHIGHDEVYQIGVCPKCRGTSPQDLFAADVKRIYNYLAARGIKTMMWSDMLQPVTKYKTAGAVRDLPRDIVMLDFIWYFHLDKDIEENLLPYGYLVAFGNLYSSHFPRFESRIRRAGIIGGQISTWTKTEEQAFQKEGKFYDFCMVAQMLWDARYDHRHRPTYHRMIASLMPHTREGLKGIRYPSLLREAHREWMTRRDDGCYVSPQEGAAYQSLVITHTLTSRYSRLPWKEQEPVGQYCLIYADGSEETLTVENGRQVGYCAARPGEPLKNPVYRHDGYTASYECDGVLMALPSGKWITAYRYEHLLPKGKRLLSVTWVQDPTAVPLEVLSVEGIMKNDA
ncbi:MAG: family 20 glycosylhydrolase [Clostridia bacterium]|nr:family 20 glycosylhydrolase [Clostridia bacterium]